MVRLEELKAGPALVVCALVVNERNETAEYLTALSPKGRKRLDYVFQRLAELGRAGFRDETFRRLEGVVCEMKEHGTNTRSFCFTSGNRLIVCTHAARKPAGNVRYQMEIDRMQRLYELCLVEGALL